MSGGEAKRASMSEGRVACRPCGDDARASRALYGKLRPGPGRPPSKVAAHQRARIQGATIELVAERGYAEVTLRRLTRLAGVSALAREIAREPKVAPGSHRGPQRRSPGGSRAHPKDECRARGAGQEGLLPRPGRDRGGAARGERHRRRHLARRVRSFPRRTREGAPRARGGADALGAFPAHRGRRDAGSARGTTDAASGGGTRRGVRRPRGGRAPLEQRAAADPGRHDEACGERGFPWTVGS